MPSSTAMASDGRMKPAPSGPLISIITVVRNGELLLARTIDSVLGQTYKNTELIIIDGASTDGTVDVIRSYGHSVSRWISEPDGGVYSAMNKAIRMCHGDYLYFLNCADRLVQPHTLEEVANHLHREAPDIFCGNVLVEYEEGVRLRRPQIASEYQLYRETVCHQALFATRQVFATAGDFDVTYRICADREWLLRAIKRHDFRVRYCDMPICVFDGRGISSRQRGRLRRENIAINRRYFGARFYPFLMRQFAEKMRRLLLAAPDA